ncbi:hypothetical protein SUGI_0808730 [Cryptomeria japonica]|nr:hypothetical protein SUGI_0808730 [Cryptomeria japonica]
MAAPYVPVNSITALFVLEEPAYLTLTAESVVTHNNNGDIDHICAFMDDNGLDKTNIKDIAYGSIYSNLLSSDVLYSDDEDSPNLAKYVHPAAQAPAINRGKVRLGLIPHFMTLAWKMKVTALHAYAQGIKDGDIPWLDSFKAVLETCCLMATKVLHYKITRLSTPGLIGRAISLIPYNDVLNLMDDAAIADYRTFAQAGVAGQVAAGALSIFCKGNVAADANTPDQTIIADLAAYKNVPYHEGLIRQAYIILEELGVLPRKWYQGEKAMARVTIADIHFRAVVKAVIAYNKSDGM